MATVVVQGFKFLRRQCCYVTPESWRACEEEEKTLLEQYFSTRCKEGSVKCTHLYLPNTKFFITQEYGNFAYMTFDSGVDAARICDAAKKKKMKITNNHKNSTVVQFLTVTPLSDSHVPIEKLNDHCLKKILSMFTLYECFTLEKVCTRWEKIVVRNVKRFHQRMDDCANVKLFEERLTKYGPHILELHCDIPSRRILSRVAIYCRKLEVLEIKIDSREKDLVNDATAVFASLRILKSVTVSTSLSFSQLGAVLELYLPDSVEKIDIRVGQHKGPQKPVNFSRFRKLRTLAIRGKRIEEGQLIGLQNLKNLIDLNVGSLDFCPFSYASEIQQLQKLKILKLQSCPIDDDALDNILMNNRDLEHLDLHSMFGLTDRSVRLTSTLLHLKYLDLSDISGITLKFMGAMPSLERLTCRNCNGVSNEAMERVVRGAPKLRFLNVENCSITSEFLTTVNAVVKDRHNDLKLCLLTHIHVDRDMAKTLEFLCLNVASDFKSLFNNFLISQ